MQMILAVAVLLYCFHFQDVRASEIFIANQNMSKMVELTMNLPYCYVHTDSNYIQTTLLNGDPIKVKQMPDESIEKLEDACRNNDVQSENIANRAAIIFPGTKWCGPGNIAEDYSDLGFHAKEDACCRDHDNCPAFLGRNECKNGLCNNSPFTRSHCDCDEIFKTCLQNVQTETANTIGAIYFNIVRVMCFKETTTCIQKKSYDLSSVNNERNPNSLLNYYFSLSENDCEYEFIKSRRYIASRTQYQWKHKKARFINNVFRKLKIL